MMNHSEIPLAFLCLTVYDNNPLTGSSWNKGELIFDVTAVSSGWCQEIKKLSLLCSMTGNSGLILMDTCGGVNTDTRVASLDLPSPSTLDSWQEYIPPSSLLTFLRRDIFRHSSMDIRVETRVELDFVTILNRILKLKKNRVTPSPSLLEFRLWILDLDPWLGAWTLKLELDFGLGLWTRALD